MMIWQFLREPTYVRYVHVHQHKSRDVSRKNNLLRHEPVKRSPPIYLSCWV